MDLILLVLVLAIVGYAVYWIITNIPMPAPFKLAIQVIVFLVVLIFLQSWRAAIIPIVAIPIALVATFAVQLALGYSINSLSLFALVLAVGIVVDDAIVVVENV